MVTKFCGVPTCDGVVDIIFKDGDVSCFPDDGFVDFFALLLVVIIEDEDDGDFIEVGVEVRVNTDLADVVDLFDDGADDTLTFFTPLMLI